MYKILDEVLQSADGDLFLVVGDCSGADELAREWAQERNIPFEIFVAEWEKHGRAAGPIRNKAMIDHGFDLLLAFPGDLGTANMIKQTEKAGIKIKEHFR